MAETAAPWPRNVERRAWNGGGRASAGHSTLPLMPPPLPKNPTKKMPEIQVFGRDDSPATRAALRFFRERRVAVHYVDLRKRGIAPGELKRFSQQFGAAALLDPTSRPYRDQGLQHLTLDQAGMIARLLADTRLLRLPLARHANAVTVGPAEDEWTTWLRPADGP
jgi:arsenate reductase